MDTILSIAVFNSGNNENLIRTDLRARLSKLSKTLRAESAIMLSHEQHTTSSLAKSLAQALERPSPVVGPGGMNVADSGDFHDDLILRLHQIAMDRGPGISREDFPVIGTPVIGNT